MAGERKTIAINDFLQVNSWKKVFQHWLAKFPHRKSIRDNESKLAAGTQYAYAHFKEWADKLKFFVRHARPALAVELALLRIARGYERRVTNDQVEPAVEVCPIGGGEFLLALSLVYERKLAGKCCSRRVAQHVWEIDSPGEI